MYHVNSQSIETCLSIRMARTMRNVLAGLVTAVVLVVQSANAGSRATMTPKDFPVGVPIQVQTIDGKVFQGKLVSRSGASFEMLDPGSGDAITIEYNDVNKVTKVAPPPRRRGHWIGPAIMVGVFLGITGVAVAKAGTLY